MNKPSANKELKPKSKIDDMRAVPQILLGYVRNPEGKIIGIKHCDFKLGIRIERCGRTYEVMENGRQVRVK